MGIKIGPDLAWLYKQYVGWFKATALPRFRPKFPEELFLYPVKDKDVFEDSKVLLNRMYYAVPLDPLQTLSAHPESFFFSELILMEKVSIGEDEEDDEILDSITVEYSVLDSLPDGLL